MILYRQADVYAPDHLGIQDVLVCGGRVEAIGDKLEGIRGCRVVEAEGRILTPGLIDRHEHIIGGGGEGSFHTRTPEIMLSELIRAGITTVLGLLGTDDVTRSVENLVAKAKGLTEEGITAYTLCGAYGYPSATITGSVKKDIAFLTEMLGVKLALSDHRAPNVTTEELIRLASDVRTAAMIGGKAGMVVIHMGSGEAKLSQVYEALKRTGIPAKTFHPTHMTRTKELFLDGFELARLGGTIDITCEDFDIDRKPAGKMTDWLDEAKAAGVPMERITFSSDGQGSWSTYDKQGRLERIGVTSVGNLYCQLVSLVKSGGLPLSEALTYFTSNVAKAMEIYPRKGCIAVGADADLLLMDQTLKLDCVMAKGRLMMEEGTLLTRGTYERN